MRQKPVVGLIGGMGSGKSLVAAIFMSRGARVISGDQLGHEGLRQPDIRTRLVERWGQDVLNELGQIDRSRVAAIVFADSAERRALEALVFPWIERRLKEEIAAAQADASVRLIIVDAAIMLEAGWNRVCDRLVFVDAAEDTRWRRLLQKRGWSATDVQAREKAQMPLADKRSRADYIVDNSGSPEELARLVDDLLRQWKIAQ
jgi:dephospho-CoA kinase